MNKFVLCIIVAIVAGVGSGWGVNYKRYAHRTGRFGPFEMEGGVAPKDALAQLDKQVPNKQGRVEMPGGSDHDFGTMTPNEKGEHIFLVKNVGDGDLNLRIGASTCKCTLGSLKRDVLAPGEEAEVKLEWEIKTHEAEFKQSAQLLTNDPNQVAINLNIHGTVVRDVARVPNEWSFGEVAAGDPIELNGRFYNYMEERIVARTPTFNDEEIDALCDFEVTEYTPSEAKDGAYGNAKQAFEVKVVIKGGLRQGALSRNFGFTFEKVDDEGNVIAPEEGKGDSEYYVLTKTTGRIIGKLGLLPSSRVQGSTGGGFVFDFGKRAADGDLTEKTFVVLKGEERENTNLRIGTIEPEGVIKATLGEPKGRGSMTLFPLEIELKPGEKKIARMGKNADDYGNIWIESDNPKVTKMRIAVKFEVGPRE